ncbi:hypothetical protein H4R34_000499 [Dimargaris verticillata]|uniref:Amine oxidase n=1 Tax=Dimargaris verticillata TaxID=2761393 RepID=A0A9W8B7Y8_9FUNG|nr:hypothetical protein H4R34_000499 [Dimargaris verticillata]
MATPKQSKRVAVIGSGISGLGAAWLLQNHSPHTVTVYEAEAYIGGHTHTVDYKPLHDKRRAEQHSVPVDTGFIVYNELTYPNLIAFFRHLRVATQPSSMTFAVSRDHGAFEWAGTSLLTLFGQASNLWRPSFWRMLYDVLRFNWLATDLLSLPETHPHRHNLSIGEYLDMHRYSQSFRDNYLIPMTAAVWSTPMNKCALRFPAFTLIQFLHNHCLLSVVSRPQWRTVSQGSRSYVDHVTAGLDDLRPLTKVERVQRVYADKAPRTLEGIRITDASGQCEEFDYAIFATHADQALAILGPDATADEQQILGAFEFSQNRAVLHSDPTLMPARSSLWSSWNYMMVSKAHCPGAVDRSGISLTYWMNELQNIDATKFGSIFVSLNPLEEPHPKQYFGEWVYTHPMMTSEAVDAQQRLARAQYGIPSAAGSQTFKNLTGTLFCGAWSNYGFHEDGLTSGLRAAAALGAECPFPIADATKVRNVPIQSSQVIRFIFGLIDACTYRWGLVVLVVFGALMALV